MNENNLNSTTQQDDAQVDGTMIDYKKLLTMAVANWRWFVVSMVICVLAACVYLLFVPSTVTVSGKMELIDKSKNSSMSAGLAMLNNLPMGIGSGIVGSAAVSSIEAEKEIILSNPLVTNVVKDLKLYTECRLCKWNCKTLLYLDCPVEVTLDDAHLAWLDTELPLYYHQIKLTISKDDDGYTVEPTLIDGKVETELPAQTFAQLPAVVKTESGTLTIKANSLPEKLANAYNGDYTLEVTITPPTLVANSFIARSTFEAASKKVTNLASVSVTDENLMRGIDYVNHLVEAYNKRANDEKNEEALKTDEFVNARLAKLDAELGSSDAAWENSKKNFQITEPEIDAQEALTKKSEYEARLVSIGTELQLHDFLSDYISDPANLYEIIPSGFVSSSASSSKSTTGATSASSGIGNASLISQHNALVNERKELLKSVSEMSPQVQRLNEAIKDLHPTLKLAMKRDRQQLMMQKSVVEREYARYSGRIGSAPKMERVLTEIGRQREIKQGVYLLMLQKREDIAMELANVTDKGKLVVPPAEVISGSLSRRKSVLIAAFLVGTLLPTGVLYLLLMFKTRIDARDELEAVTNLPILAEIDTHSADDAIRNLRTHLLLNLKKDQKAILVASNNHGDGKTFIAKKLEESLAAIGKKVVLINANLRDNNCQLSMVNGQFGKCSHPSDVLASADFAQQMADAKASNDYVIIDSPALSEYSDGYQLATFADVTLYVVKAGTAHKSDIEALNSNNNIPNPLIVFNV